jgi:lipid II:glycine glycyltransferase (peptidoglycan interpeptide bridge formation enzyme)
MYDEHLNILVNIGQSEEALWKDVHTKRRNEIRRAYKEGTSFRELVTETGVGETYRILEDVYGKAKLPLHDRSMFSAAFETLRPKGMIRFFGAINQNKLIGVIVVLCYKDRIYDWYAGSYREYYDKYPNDLLPWEVFLWGKKNGYKVFDFGGAGKPAKPYGVRDYKKKYGGELVCFGRYEKIHKPLLMQMGKLGFKLWQGLR